MPLGALSRNCRKVCRCWNPDCAHSRVLTPHLLSTGKTENAERGIRKTPHQQLMSKLDRRNKARQKQQVKHKENIRATSVFAGQNGAPRHIAVVPLTEDVDTQKAIHLLNESVDVPADVSENGTTRVRVDRFRQNVMYIPAKRDLMSALDTCRLADFVVLVLSAKEEVDDTGELILRSIEGQGISNVQTVVQVYIPNQQPSVLFQCFYLLLTTSLGLGCRRACEEATSNLFVVKIVYNALFPDDRKDT